MARAGAPLLTAQAFPLPDEGHAELLFTLEAHASPLDGRVAPRPYVYGVSARGLTAKWRGSGLAWPLIDAIVLPSGLLCALHEDGSFLAPRAMPAESERARRIALYRWNGFGFTGVDDASERSRCAASFDSTR